jgi:PEP-CTERM motif
MRTGLIGKGEFRRFDDRSVLEDSEIKSGVGFSLDRPDHQYRKRRRPKGVIMSIATRSMILTVLGIATLGLAGSVSAGTQVYTNQASFLANVQAGYYLETFDSLPSGTIPSQSFSQGGFSYTASAALGLFNLESPSGDKWLSVSVPGDRLVFTLTSGNITAIGGYFFTTDFGGDVTAGTVTATVNDGTTDSVTNPSSTNFIGFISTSPITSLSISSFNFATANDLIVGTGVQGSVPEPSTLVMAGFALMVGVAVSRRNRIRPTV